MARGESSLLKRTETVPGAKQIVMLSSVRKVLGQRLRGPSDAVVPARYSVLAEHNDIVGVVLPQISHNIGLASPIQMVPHTSWVVRNLAPGRHHLSSAVPACGGELDSLSTREVDGAWCALP
jgi:hypothetical protein